MTILRRHVASDGVRPVVLKIFAGSGLLSCALRRRGFVAFPLDISFHAFLDMPKNEVAQQVQQVQYLLRRNIAQCPWFAISPLLLLDLVPRNGHVLVILYYLKDCPIQLLPPRPRLLVAIG